MKSEPNWDWELSTSHKWYQLNLKELFSYKDLIISFYRRELLSAYQQTIVGMSWMVLQPVLTTLFYFLVFGKIVKVSTDNTPAILFYMSGSILWAFFSDCMSGAMYSFLHNAHIFNKVYFPRLVVPLSLVLNHSVRFCVQLALFVVVYFGLAAASGHVGLSTDILLLPVLLLQIAALALGVGLIVSVYVARYRDVEYIMGFVLRLFMFVTPVFYPASIVPPRYHTIFWLNPLTPILESFRTIFFHNQPLHYKYLIASGVSSVVVLVAGLILFKSKELTVMDTI